MSLPASQNHLKQHLYWTEPFIYTDLYRHFLALIDQTCDILVEMPVQDVS